MIAFILWYLAISIVGWATIPLAFNLLPNLKDRGLSMTRPLGLILWGFIFWLLTSLQIFQNNSGGILFAFFILAGLSAWSIKRNWKDMLDWYRQRIRLLVIEELLFLAAFAALAVIRAANPDIAGTEKPMELAFINSLLRSPTFPPMDLWLSGYGISYYYFGYVMVAMLARVTGIVSGVAFNLAIASWFGMTALAAYGIMFSLVRSWKEKNPRLASHAYGWSLLAPFFILISSNIEGFLEMLHARGLFWSKAADGSMQSTVWNWLNILELNQPPSLSTPSAPTLAGGLWGALLNSPLAIELAKWVPSRPGGIWWWRASRVIQDFDMLHQPREIIDEFPFFSYLLADLHPHVLAMPFVLLAVGLAINLYFQPNLALGKTNLFSWVNAWINGKQPSFKDTHLAHWVRRLDFWLAALVLGGLAFLNTWDFPIYIGLFCGAYTLLRYQQKGWSIQRVFEFIELGLMVGIAGILLYFPFYTGFSSQAGGLLPSLDFFTRGIYFWIFFGVMLLPIFAWLIYCWRKQGPRPGVLKALAFSAMVVGGLWALSYLFGWLISFLSSFSSILTDSNPNSILAAKLTEWGGLFAGLHGGASTTSLLVGSLGLRLMQPGTWLTLLVLLGLVWGLFSTFRKPDVVNEAVLDEGHAGEEEKTEEIVERSPDAFVLLLILVGIGLTLVPEFVYLRDQFGWRMNTIFKFFFQTWILWGLAAAYASVVLWHELEKAWKVVFRLGWIVLILISLAYPVFGLWTKTNKFSPDQWTLDGNYFQTKYNEKEMEAIHWLEKAPLGVVAEASSPTASYSMFTRVATLSGLPTIIGWPGHESQWRGGAREIGSRLADIDRLYRTNSWEEAQTILKQYAIRYIFIGNLERNTYKVNEIKFQQNLKPVFQNDSVIIYEFPDAAGIQAAQITQ
jgi:YYY domain-containing protein